MYSVAYPPQEEKVVILGIQYEGASHVKSIVLVGVGVFGDRLNRTSSFVLGR